MEEAAELSNYLPLSFKTPKEQEYIEFLRDAFETNSAHGKYQFAFLAYHMLTMSFVYFNIWQIKPTARRWGERQQFVFDNISLPRVRSAHCRRRHQKTVLHRAYPGLLKIWG